MLGIERQRNIENLDRQLIGRTTMQQMEKMTRNARHQPLRFQCASPCHGSDTSTAASVRLAQAADRQYPPPSAQPSPAPAFQAGSSLFEALPSGVHWREEAPEA